MAVVAAAGRRVGLMGEASTATGNETPRGETHVECVLGRGAGTADFAELASWGHGALGERLASTASSGRRVARH